MCVNHFTAIYRLCRNRGLSRVVLIEADVETGSFLSLTEDDRRNEKFHYERLFSEECRAFTRDLFADMSNAIRLHPYAESADMLDLLAFLQEVVATALWKYGLEADESLIRFAREFDRLDVEEERIRLWESFQQAE